MIRITGPQLFPLDLYKYLCQSIISYIRICVLGGFQKANELLNIRALNFSQLNKMHIFQCLGKIFCVEFQRVPLKIPHKISSTYID